MSEQTTKTVTEEALEVARWLGTGQALLARLQELESALWLMTDVGITSEKELTHTRSRVGQLIGEAVKHFGEMP